MNTSVANITKPRLSQFSVLLIILLVNIPLVTFSGYIHYSLAGNVYGDNLINNFGVWLLTIFKIGGANIALWQILRDFNIHS